MPRIELITPVYYSPNDPIHWEIDNIPLKNIIQRQELINFAIDNALDQIRDAAGTQGTFSNRLNQSLNDDGSLKTSAIDDALHSIEAHTDTANYVRMTKAQSDKLDAIADNATDVSLEVYTDSSSFVSFDSGTVKIEPSSTIIPEVEAPNIVRFRASFPDSAAHQHYYGIEPVHENLVSPDYKNFKVSSVATPFIDGSLRVYINGVRIFEDMEVYVPGAMLSDDWKLFKFTPDPPNGKFQLSSAISEMDVIKIDFDVSLTS